MQVLKTMPKGAISSVAELGDLLSEAKSETVTVWSVNGGHPGEPYAYEIRSESAVVQHNIGPFIRLFYPGERDLSAETSLWDNNIIPNGYNDNYLFTNKLLAKQFSDFAASDPDMRAEAAARKRHCDRLFRDIWF